MAARTFTLYYQFLDPFCQRVRIALTKAGAKYDAILIDVKDKPAYFKELNPAGQVPVITYGDPAKDGVPSPTSFKLAESGVIAEFVADLYPDAGLLPSSAIDRAKVRFFIDKASKGYVPSMTALVFGKGTHEPLLKDIEALQGLLEPGNKYFAGDDITLADALIAPFVISYKNMKKPEVGAKPDGEFTKLVTALKDEKYSAWDKYSDALSAHPIVTQTFDDAAFVGFWAGKL